MPSDQERRLQRERHLARQRQVQEAVRDGDSSLPADGVDEADTDTDEEVVQDANGHKHWNLAMPRDPRAGVAPRDVRTPSNRAAPYSMAGTPSGCGHPSSSSYDSQCLPLQLGTPAAEPTPGESAAAAAAASVADALAAAAAAATAARADDVKEAEEAEEAEEEGATTLSDEAQEEGAATQPDEDGGATQGQPPHQIDAGACELPPPPQHAPTPLALRTSRQGLSVSHFTPPPLASAGRRDGGRDAHGRGGHGRGSYERGGWRRCRPRRTGERE